MLLKFKILLVILSLSAVGLVPLAHAFVPEGHQGSSLGFVLAESQILPNGITYADGMFWSVDLHDRSVYVYDSDGTPKPESGFSLNMTNAFPSGITHHDGKLWVADTFTHMMHVYDTSGMQVDGFYLGDEVSPTGLASYGGKLWVVDNISHKVFAYNTDGTQDAASGFTLDHDNFAPTGITHAADKLWVVDTVNHRIYAYLDGNHEHTSQLDLDHINTIPTGITYAHEKFYVLDVLEHSVFVYEPAEAHAPFSEFELDAGNTDPSGVTFADGKYWAVDHYDDRVYAYDASGKLVSDAGFALHPLNTTPQGITHLDDKFWVIDLNSNVFVYKDGMPYGDPPHFATEGLIMPGGITNDGTQLWVIDFYTEKFVAYNVNGTADQNAMYDLAEGNKFAIGITYHAGKFWVADHLAKNIQAYNSTTGVHLPNDTFNLDSVNGDPVGITFAGGMLRVIDHHDHGIYAYDITDKMIDLSARLALTPGNKDPTGVTFANGQLWTSDGHDYRAFAYDTTGVHKPSLEFKFDDSNKFPKGITTNGTILWVVDAFDDRVYAYDDTDNETAGTHIPAAGFELDIHNTEPSGITFANDKLWVVDDLTDEVYAYLTDGTLADSFMLDSANKNPTGITFANCNMWVTDSNKNHVYAYSTMGMLDKSSGFALDSDNSSPTGITYADGKFWVVDANDRAYAYDAEAEPCMHLLSTMSLDGYAIEDMDDNPSPHTDTTFGWTSANIGDLDDNGTDDFAIGVPRYTGSHDTGEVHIFFMMSDGTVKDTAKIDGGNVPGLEEDDRFGESLAYLGDLDGPGGSEVAIAVGAPGHTLESVNSGDVYVIFLNPDGTVYDTKEAIPMMQDGMTMQAGSQYGKTVENVGDMNNDGIPDLAVGAPGEVVGRPVLAGAVYLLFMDMDGSVKETLEISGPGNGLPAAPTANFGISVAGIGDLDENGTLDIVVGSSDTGTTKGSGTLYVIFMDSSSIMKTVEINEETLGAHGHMLMASDSFGEAVSSVGDLNNDGVLDLAVGAPHSLIGAGEDTGEVYILLMNSTGGVKNVTKIDQTTDGLSLESSIHFGKSVNGMGDLNNDDTVDLAVGTYSDDTLYILYMNPDGTLLESKELTAKSAGLDILQSDQFGTSIARLGDLDGDGIPDIAAGASGFITGGTTSGDLYVMFMNSNGTVREFVKINQDTEYGTESDKMTIGLGINDRFGTAVASLGDLDGDGTIEVAVGAPGHIAGSGVVGDVYILSINKDGMLMRVVDIDEDPIAPQVNPNERFGESVANIGDLDGDGTVDLAVGAPNRTTGGNAAGDAYVIFLNMDGTIKDQKVLVPMADGKSLLSPGDRYGSSVAGIGDIDGDNVLDIAVGAAGHSINGVVTGDLFILHMNSDGTIKYTTEINSETRNAPDLQSGDLFGASVTNLGDLDGNNIDDIAVGAPGHVVDGKGTGDLYVMFMGYNGTIIRSIPIDDLTPYGPTLKEYDRLGESVELIGDLDGDGSPEIAMGAPGSNSLHIVFPAPQGMITELDIGLLLGVGQADWDGLQTKIAADLALKDFNENLPNMGRDWRLTAEFMNTELNPDKALEQVMSLRGNGTDVIVGVPTSASVTKVKDYINDNDMALISCCSTASQLAMPDNIFRMVPDDTMQAVLLAEHITLHNRTDIITIYRNDTWGVGLKDALTESFKKLNGTVIDTIPYEPRDPSHDDFAGIVDKASEILEMRSDNSMVGIVFLGWAETADMMVVAASNDMLSGLKWFGSGDSVGEVKLLEEPALTFATMTRFSAVHFKQQDTEISMNLMEQISDVLDRNPDVYAYSTYDAIWVAGQAIAEAKTDIASDVIPLIPKVAKDRTMGAMGPNELNKAGDLKSATYTVHTIEDGMWVDKGDVKDVVLDPPMSMTATITGTVFVDENENGMLDDGEQGVPGHSMLAITDNQRQAAMTDSDGMYSFVIPSAPAQTIIQVASYVEDHMPTGNWSLVISAEPGSTTQFDIGFAPAS